MGANVITRFEILRAMAYGGLHTVVAVPSRLYFPPSPEKPLNGKRIAVKDNYHIAGTVTTLGNRSYARFYGIQNVTSTYAKRLIDQGAIIVGKTKLSSFAGTEGPPNGAIDYLPSFNPRADGYQKPHGSSIGSSTAVAGYEWLDYSLATDSKAAVYPHKSFGS
jgi:Asp-tRNA(Asn)/Glu-tRNA(Gln) amidotransferase A subunit family amidase